MEKEFIYSMDRQFFDGGIDESSLTVPPFIYRATRCE